MEGRIFLFLDCVGFPPLSLYILPLAWPGYLANQISRAIFFMKYPRFFVDVKVKGGLPRLSVCTRSPVCQKVDWYFNFKHFKIYAHIDISYYVL